MEYKNKDYQKAITEYKIGNDKLSLCMKLSFMSRGEITEYDEETFYFVKEAIILANKQNDEEVKNLCVEFAIKQVQNGNTYLLTAILPEYLQSENDCLKVLNYDLSEGRYRVVLSKIIDFIQKKKSMQIAYLVLKTIHKQGYGNNNVDVDKKEAELYFISKMQNIIETDVMPTSFLGLHYKSDNWGKRFKNDEYVRYIDLAMKIKKAH